ncbi:pyridoxal phosphate-dependent decarboxylase family protein [Rhizobium sp. PL01]|uniref:pyridoxal phosphate-dependent decarboxylase family protein n=1 Tax=Rhizobium sp. PL01 TaxID=3085631 RepID=UPI002982B7F1|nr:pyridoxal-dependent decarboxylase [Rhizobium sp. PL01]MDW5313888.1 pyridoxal-dependent decarboxylase [Rhizobium sp. PL01]
MNAGALFQRAATYAAEFRRSVADRAQRPAHDYAQSVAVFSEELPEHGSPADSVLDTLIAKAEPGLHMPTGPRFFGWVMGGSHPAGVAADFLTSAWGQNAGNHVVAPSAAAVEAIAARWLLELLDLPRESSVGFVTGATLANFTCLAAARGEVLRAVDWDVDKQGLFGAPQITVVIGDDAHTTVFSALQFLGLGHDRVLRVATDDQGRMRPAAFSEAFRSVRGPAIAILQAGQINTGDCDDFATLVPIAKSQGAWVHVDGAFGLWAQASPQRRSLTTGAGLADSWATDGHKWLQTPYDCGYAIVRNEMAHRRAMSIAASYLPLPAEGERDPSHYVPELSRRARGFPTWSMIKHLGRDGIAALIDQNCDAAGDLAGRLDAEPGIEIINRVVLNQVIVRFGSGLGDDDADDLTKRTIARLQKDGTAFAAGALWRGRHVMRLSFSNYQTDATQVEIAARAIIEAYRNVRREGGIP